MALRHRFTFGGELLWLRGAAICAVVVVALGGLFAVLQLREEVTEHTTGAARNLAASVTQTFDGLFDMMDVALLASVDEIERQQATGKPLQRVIDQTLERQALRIPHVAYLRATNALGDVIYGPGLPVERVNLSDRDFFRQMSRESNVGVVMAKPLVGRISGKPLLTLVRRIQTPAGEFAGVVYATIFVEELERMLAKIPVGHGGTLALRDQSLGLIVRHVSGEANQISMGSAALSAPFMAEFQKQPDAGIYVSESTPQDPVARTSAYRRSEKYGFLVDVGTPLESQMREWRLQALLVGGLVLLFAAALWLLVSKISSSRGRTEGMLRSLRLADAQHRALLGSLSTGVVVHAPDTQIIFCNQRACELLGLSEEQMRGKTAIDPAWCFVDDNGAPLALEKYPVSRVLATAQAIDEMVIGVKVPGRNWLVWLQGSAFPEFDEVGALKQVVVNFHDITKRREAEERWRFALEGAGDGVWDLDVETGAAVYSRRYIEMLGYGENEVPGLHSEWVKRVHPEDLERVQSEITDQLKMSSGTVASEYRLLCKDGNYKWIHARGMVVSRGSDGQPLRIVGTHTDISEKKAAEATIWQQANFDPLTGLPNRRLFYDRLDMKMRQSQRETSGLALLFIDLDRFKEVNDTLGHDVGDQLLVEAAQRITHVVRNYDTVARLGGDEFTVILAGHHQSFDVGAVAQKVIDRLSEPFMLGGHETYVSASIGIALFPDDAQSVNALVKNADQAMYAAKAAGRKGFRFFTKGMQDSAINRMLLVNDLRHAVAEDQFEVHYQPIVDLATGRVHKAEALVRWRHPVRGLVPPSQFIPVAEDIGAIHEIGDWMFKQAVTQLSLWKERYGSNFQLSVNKSPLQFVAAGHGRWLRQLEEIGVDGNSIVIEITEGVLMDSNAAVAQSLFQFRDSGIQVAIDDFGTGYSSLSYLKKFDIDYLKIDQSFVRNLSQTSPDYALCEAIIVMAHKLGLKVIAEGVETEAQRDLLREVACDYAQGYLFARPMPASDFEAYMQTIGQISQPGSAMV